MLENAVHPLEALRAVKTQATQLKAHSGNDLTYPQYTDLLLSAAQQHDKSLVSTPGRVPRRRVYAHDIDYGEDPSDYDVHSIDSDIDAILIHNSMTNPRPVPRLTHDQWTRLTDEAKRTWNLLSAEAKSIILHPCPPSTGTNNDNLPMCHPLCLLPCTATLISMMLTTFLTVFTPLLMMTSLLLLRVFMHRVRGANLIHLVIQLRMSHLSPKTLVLHPLMTLTRPFLCMSLGRRLCHQVMLKG